VSGLLQGGKETARLEIHKAVCTTTTSQEPRAKSQLPNLNILCLNAGSSSLKFATFRIGDSAEERISHGAIENTGGNTRFWIKDAGNKTLHDGPMAKTEDRIATIFEALEKQQHPRPSAVGHRIVHGGPLYTGPAKINPEVLENLRQLVSFAPLHLPNQIQLIEAVSKHYPGLPQVACFDTAFHNDMPERARRLPLPRDLWDQGIRRYGFHGLSYEYILSVLGGQGKGRVIIAHLGNGASMVAVRDGRPLDTTMGLTPAGGFMMSTRSGDLDPGVLLHLLRQGYNVGSLEELVDQQSGLRGVSGISGDMQVLLAKSLTDAAASQSGSQAIDMFCYAIRKYVGAFAAALGGLDLLVFTGGIGEHAAPVRRQICEGLEFLGIEIDTERNQQNAPVISARESGFPKGCTVRVVPTDEDLMIARHTAACVRTGG
jgi:acetate kinase